MKKITVALMAASLCAVSAFSQSNIGGISATRATAQTMTGALNVPVLQGAYNVAACANSPAPSWCSGSDIGGWINAAVTADAQTILIPDGTYAWSTGISITQSGSQRLTIQCSSRNATLNYTGSGDAIYWTAAGSPTAQLSIENCTLNGSGAHRGTNGIHAYYAQSFRLTNATVENFPGVNLLSQGLIGATILNTDILSAGLWNWELEPDTTHSFASNANRMIGGSLQYGGSGNFWDAGISSVYGSDTQNGLIGVVMEMSANVPQFIVEGTWNDYIEDSYIEYINFSTSTGNLYSGWVGNYSGSGVGSNSAYTASNFLLQNNFLITPRAGKGFTTATFFVANSLSLTAVNLTDEGAPTYGFSFYSSGSNAGASATQLHIGWQAGLILNPPSDINNLSAGAGGSIVYRCRVAGTLPVGALTTSTANCGTAGAIDSGLRTK